MKITKQQLKQIIKEQLKEMSQDTSSANLAAKLAAAGSAEKPYEASAALLKMFAELYPAVKNEPQEAKALADTIFALLDTSADNVKHGYNLEEGFDNVTPENLKLVYDVMVKMAPMLSMLAIGTPLLMAIEKRLSKGDSLDEKIEDAGGGDYYATSKSGRRLSKKSKSKKDAQAQLAAVEISKAERGKK